MDQHTFLELVVLGAAIVLSGYIGYAVGHYRGYLAGKDSEQQWRQRYAEGQRAEFHEKYPDIAGFWNDQKAAQRYTREQLRPMTKEELRKFNDPYDRS